MGNESYEVLKFVAAALGALLIAAGCSACGVTTGGGFVLGTTSFLQEANRTQQQARHAEKITERDREQLAALVQRQTAGR